MFEHKRLVRKKIYKGIFRDVAVAAMALVFWVSFSAALESFGHIESRIQIKSIGLVIPVHTLLYYTVYLGVIIIVARSLAKGVEKYLFLMLKNHHRKRFLITRIAHFVIYISAILFVLSVLSIDTRVIATIGGALSIGLGFGLQKVASNFVSGVILFIEQSVRIDDIIELPDGTSGVVKQVSARYTMLESFQGKEIFVPNEEMVVAKVINWTHLSNTCRDDIHITIDHNADLEAAVRIIKEQAKSCRALAPNSTCYIYGYGNNGVDIAIRMWILDVKEHFYDVREELLIKIIMQFRANNIGIPSQKFDITTHDAQK